jgi:hypothetical protein
MSRPAANVWKYGILAALVTLPSYSQESGRRQTVTDRETRKRFAEIERFITVPEESLPKNVRLIAEVKSSPIIPARRNPDVFVEAKDIEPVAAFFGIREKADLQRVKCAVVAVYQDGDPSKEIGVFAVRFATKKAAGDWLAGLAKKAGKEVKELPYFHKGPLLVYAWMDPGANEKAFEAVREYFRKAEFSTKKGEQNEK